MISEDRLVVLLREANPVPELDEYDVEVPDDLSHLKHAEQRRTEVTQLNEKPKRPATRSAGSAATNQPRWLVAAIAIVVIGLAIVLVVQATNEEPVASNPAVTTTVPAPTTVPESALSGIPEWVGQGMVGTFRSREFTVPFAFTMPSGNWITGTAEPNVFAVCSPAPGSNCWARASVAAWLLDAGTVDETRDYLRSFPGAVIADEATTSIGGAQGITFTFTHDLGGSTGPGLPPGVDVPSYTRPANTIVLGMGKAIVSIVDVDGTIVTVVYQGKTETVSSATPFEEELADGMAIVDSIQWEALG